MNGRLLCKWQIGRGADRLGILQGFDALDVGLDMTCNLPAEESDREEAKTDECPCVPRHVLRPARLARWRSWSESI